MDVDGHWAIVSGGASGLGAATARHLAELGAHVLVLDRDEGRAAALAHDIGGQAASADVAEAAAVGRVIDDLDTAPRIAVNCAGIAPAARIVDRDGQTSIDTFEAVIRINLLGTYNMMSHATRRMMELDPLAGGERGVVINTASIAWQDGQIGQSAYAASKGAVAAMCLPAAREFARSGIRVVAIAPGLFNTPMMEGLPDEVTRKITDNIPHPDRLGQPEEFAHLVSHIIQNPYLNGTTIRLDAATRLPPR